MSYRKIGPNHSMYVDLQKAKERGERVCDSLSHNSKQGCRNPDCWKHPVNLRNIPRLSDPELLIDSTQEGVTFLTSEYLSQFAVPEIVNERQICLRCRCQLGIRWGLAYGEGRCTSCSWPTRVYHFVKDDVGVEIRVVKMLQYHPSLVMRSKRRNKR